MPLDVGSMAEALNKSYNNFKDDLKNGVHDEALDNDNNSNGSNGSGGNDNTGSSGTNGQTSNGQGNNGDNSSSTTGNGDASNCINPNCPVHGTNKKEKVCPHCGHTNCGCNFHKGKDNTPVKPPNIEPSGNEINPDNWDDLVAQNDALNKDDGSDGDGGGSGSSPQADIFMKSFSKALDDELQKATPTMTNLSILTAKGTLSIKSKTNPVMYAVEISTKVMLYWSICIAPIGIPVSGVITTIVPTNTAALTMPMAQEILMTGLSASPGMNYTKLAEIIVKYSRQVVYVVTELVPGTPPTPVPYSVQLQ